MPSGGNKGRVQSGASWRLADTHLDGLYRPPWAFCFGYLSLDRWPRAWEWLNYTTRRVPFPLRGWILSSQVSRSFCGPLNETTDARPLDFSGEQDALSLAVGGWDGLQLQEVQQHLDLSGQRGGGQRGKRVHWVGGGKLTLAHLAQVLRDPVSDNSPTCQDTLD